ncbi:MAG: dienelactone hydrolase family protein, partial [Proteobacteria bacterium]
MKVALSIMLTSLITASSFAAPKPFEYKDGETVLEGMVAQPKKNTHQGAAILVVPEWNGINPYVIKRLEQLAEMGYTAFAADIYGKGVRPTTMEESAKTSNIYKNDRALFKRRMALA